MEGSSFASFQFHGRELNQAARSEPPSFCSLRVGKIGNSERVLRVTPQPFIAHRLSVGRLCHPFCNLKTIKEDGGRFPAMLLGSMKLRVLVVDDNRDAADALGELLCLYGADVRACYTGQAALELI